MNIKCKNCGEEIDTSQVSQSLAAAGGRARWAKRPAVVINWYLLNGRWYPTVEAAIVPPAGRYGMLTQKAAREYCRELARSTGQRVVAKFEE